MRAIVVADSETDPFDYKTIPSPFIWGVYDGEDYYQFYDTREFVEFVSREKWIIYAHNGGKFDWHFILEHIAPWSQLMVINGRLSKFTIGECEFRDSYNILPVPLSAYKKDDFDYSRMQKGERDKPHNKEAIEKYLKNDCVYLHELISQFVNDYGLQLTLAGAALKQWEKIEKQKPPTTTRNFYGELSPFYYGGRVECFKTGLIETPFKVIDINSAYPSAMMENHPYGETCVSSESLPPTKAETQRAFITLECIAAGCFPFRAKNGLSFPHDNEKRIYTVTGWEFVAAIKNKAITKVKILDVITFPEKINFSSYVNHFFKMKNVAKTAKDTAGYIFAKLFLNSLYGKFGSNPQKYQEYMKVNYKHIEAASVVDDYIYCADMGNGALVSKPLSEEKHRYYNLAVAASITGYVRAQMFDSISQCKGVIYCDTDSIACEDTGSLELDPAKLGAWDIEAECVRGAVAGKKLYAFEMVGGEYKTASKGVRLTPAEIIQVAKGEEVTYRPIAPTFSINRETQFIPRKVKRVDAAN
tara:strand:+ start:7443 stop:9029 length:1587 start_codon:yes stop_codon:yes gene_type:complete